MTAGVVALGYTVLWTPPAGAHECEAVLAPLKPGQGGCGPCVSGNHTHGFPSPRGPLTWCETVDPSGNGTGSGERVHRLLDSGGLDISDVAACDHAHDNNEVDGVWYPWSRIDGQSFTMSMDSDLDANVFFYSTDSQECTQLTCRCGTLQGRGQTESGSVPLGTDYVFVKGMSGSGLFTLVVEE